MLEKYPNTFYRVAVKALIKNDKGELLLLKEKSDKWDLPGGGLDHGEEPEDGIKRELSEELGIASENITVGQSVKQKAFWVEAKQIWLMWVVYDVSLAELVEFSAGDGVTDIEYINPQQFENSGDERERYLLQLADDR